MISQAHDRYCWATDSSPLVDLRLFNEYSTAIPTEKVGMVTEYFPMIAIDKLETEHDVMYTGTEFNEAKSSI